MPSCPHCGEPTDTYPDPGGGETQTYVEDCAVCCRPILFKVTLGADGHDYRIEVSAEP
jgi:hypothetical protein